MNAGDEPAVPDKKVVPVVVRGGSAMRASGVLIILLVILANVAGWAYLNRPVEPLPFGAVINGVGFSPYQGDQDPQAGQHPTAAQIEKDLQVVAGKVRNVRTYSATDGLEQVATLAGRYGLMVTAGAWVDHRRERNEREIENVIKMARENPNVTRVMVGNEAILRGDMTVDELIAYIRRVRAEVNVPVSTAEPWHVWITHPELARAVDFIAIHILPYWEGLPVNEALDYGLSRYQQVKNAYPTKPVVITEIGWPSEGRARRGADPTPVAQATFLREFLNVARQRHFDYYIMEAFDQPWKRNIEGSVGAYWGIWDANRNPKFPLMGPVVAMPDWPKVAAISSLLALFPLVWFLRRWRDMKIGGRLFYGLLIQGASTLFVYVLTTGLSQYMPIGVAIMWAFLIPLLVLLLVLLLSEGLEAAEVGWSNPKRKAIPLKIDLTARPHWPKVSIHIPAYNEPPEMLKQTLDALARLDYPNFEVLLIDNNTKDEAVWRPIEAYCAKLGPRFKFYHVAPLTGYKAGALNFALRHTAPDAEVIGVIDSDYVVSPDWLRALVPYFDEPKVGFVQAPQDHHDWQHDLFKEMINWEYAGFFQIGMVQRNERDAIIQHGTMTLIRRKALEDTGRWGEWCICEDAELGLRLLAEGWQSLYTDTRFGHGLTPDSFTAYKSQRFRWAYGAMQILKHHWREMLPWKQSRLTSGQRYHFVAGWMPWVADAIGLVFAVASIFWTVGTLVLPRYFDFPLTLFILPALGVFGAKVLQFLWLYHLRVDCTLRQRLGAGLAGLALTYTIAKATLYGLTTSSLPFIRTPKAEGKAAFIQAFVMAKEETFLCIGLWLAALAIWFVYGADDPEAKLWSVLMAAQSVPYFASLVLSAINTMPVTKTAAATEQQGMPVAAN